MIDKNTTLPVAAQARFQDEGDEIDLRALVGTVLGARYLIAGFAAAALLAGIAYVWVATPIYQVDASVQVEDSKGSALGGAVKDLDGLFDVKSQATTEIELLRSRMVLGRTLDHLRLDIVAEPDYFPFIGRAVARRYQGLTPAVGWPGFTGFAWGGEGIKVTRLRVPEAWEGQALTLKALAAEQYALYGPDGELLGQGRVGQEFVPAAAAGAVGVFVQELRASRNVEFKLAKLPRLSTINALQQQLAASEKGKQSGIIQLTLKGPNPALAVNILNAIANQYVRQNVERKSAEAEQTLKFLDQQLPETKQQLEAAEVRFNAFRSRNGTVDVTKEGELLLQQSVATETGLVELQQKRKELLQRFTAEHPSVKALDAQIGAIQNERNKFASQVDSLPQTQQEVLRLTRDLQVNQEIYTGLLNNAQQLKVVRGGTVGNVRIIDYAEKPLRPVAPQKGLVLVLSLLLGVMLGVAAAFVRQALKSGVKNPKEIEARTGLSVFATIPHSLKQDEMQRNRSRTSGKVQVLAHWDDQDLAVESLRSLRTTLHFASLDARNNCILVSGSAPGVGKSFISVNLGAVLVAGGERVLVIDADMRRGHINEFFGRGRENGLSEVIAGVLSLDDAIISTPISGLDLLTTGAIPPNPSELLLHPKFAELLSVVSSQYDRVIIDCPPIMAVTDAAIVGRHVGTVLLAARFAVTPMAELEAAIARLRQAGVAVNGIMLNGVDDSAGYGYGYGYNYGYTYQYRSKKD
ncbi:MAG: polysaccharide biosynthesis tyrosine autokinase [Pseudomonadota bacterium]